MTISFGSHFKLHPSQRSSVDFDQVVFRFSIGDPESPYWAAERRPSLPDVWIGEQKKGVASITSILDKNDPAVERYLHKRGIAYTKTPSQDHLTSVLEKHGHPAPAARAVQYIDSFESSK